MRWPPAAAFSNSLSHPVRGASKLPPLSAHTLVASACLTAVAVTVQEPSLVRQAAGSFLLHPREYQRPAPPLARAPRAVDGSPGAQLQTAAPSRPSPGCSWSN